MSKAADMPRRTPTVASDTRERILAAALALFNADGAHAVSTRHVAERLGISPGNLYYHFANKEEIVLCLYERIEARLLEAIAPPPAAPGSFDEILAYLDRIFGHLWEFRFFYRDLTALLQDVPGLRDRYRQMSERVRSNAKQIFVAMVDAGWMDASDADLDLLATNAWIVISHWFTHRQVIDRRRTIQSADIREGIRHLVALFSPMLKPPQRRQVQRALERPA